MHTIILADNHAIFRAGTAQVLAIEYDLRIIAQCADCPRLYHSLTTFRGAIVIVSARLAGSRVILIAENGEVPPPVILTDLRGLVYRNVSKTSLMETVRTVIRGERSIHPVETRKDAEPKDPVGARVRDRLTPKEMKIVALILQGCKNRDIGMRLGTTEQVIKNYLRSIYDKTGVSDRLGLALFTTHHRILAEAANEVGALSE